MARDVDELTRIIDYSNFILISTTIDKRDLKRLNVTDNAYHIALGYCMETFHEFLLEKGESTKKTHIVFECRGDKEDKELELEFRRICDGGREAVGSGYEGFGMKIFPSPKSEKPR